MNYPLLLAMGALLACVSRQEEPAAQVAREPAAAEPAPVVDTVVVRNPRVAVFCSTEKLRTGVVRITWETDEPLFTAQTLELAVSKDGFARNAVAELPLSGGRELQLAPPARREKTLQPLTRLRVTRAEYDPRTRTATVQIEQLEPGITYFWRLSTQVDQRELVQPALRFEAPTCPADMIEAPK